VTLIGITPRNSIMLVSHYEHLVNQEGMEWGAEASRRGASERLVPILMTALVTGLGLLQLAIYSGEPGNEIEAPMAIVILGGLVTFNGIEPAGATHAGFALWALCKKTDTMETLVPTW
jgi:Cu/Ag efflux pump CusA